METAKSTLNKPETANALPGNNQDEDRDKLPSEQKELSPPRSATCFRKEKIEDYFKTEISETQEEQIFDLDEDF